MPKANSHMRDLNCIEHMLRYYEQIEEALNEISHSKEHFLSSHTYQNASYVHSANW